MKSSSHDKFESALLHTLRYFDLFEYAPTLHQAWLFHPYKISYTEFISKLHVIAPEWIITLESEQRIMRDKNIELLQQKIRRSCVMMRQVSKILHPLQYIPCVRYVGFSGSVSMQNADEDSDVDLFIVVSKGTVWMMRFCILAYIRILSFFGSSSARLVCCNLFFSEDALTLSTLKRSEYTAHELLQLMPLYDVYEIGIQLRNANSWLVGFFPNAMHDVVHNRIKKNIIIDWFCTLCTIFEYILRSIQISHLRKKGYRFYEQNGQLWLIQDDYERKVRSQFKVSFPRESNKRTTHVSFVHKRNDKFRVRRYIK